MWDSKPNVQPNDWVGNNIKVKPITVTYNNNFNSSSKAQSTIITKSDVLKSTSEYKTVSELVQNLIESGLSKMGEGYCISVSDIVFNILNQHGIKAHLMEVQLSAVDHINDRHYMVGFNTTFQQNSHTQVSTHVVVITDTEVPMLIDLCIAHRLPQGYQCIIDKAINEGDKVLCKVEHNGWSYIYQEKKEGIGIPQLHQISILERISTDKKIFDEMKSLKTLNVIGIGLSAFAVINVIAKVWLDWYN